MSDQSPQVVASAPEGPMPSLMPVTQLNSTSSVAILNGRLVAVRAVGPRAR
jgi:hypothetical protein